MTPPPRKKIKREIVNYIELYHQLSNGTQSETGPPSSQIYEDDDFEFMQCEVLTNVIFENIQHFRQHLSDFTNLCTETNVMLEAIINRNLDNVKWIWKKQTNWNGYKEVKEYFNLAALNGEFEMMKWLHENNCPGAKNPVKMQPSSDMEIE